MAIPTGATRVRLKIAPQRGQVLALAEIMAPHAGHEVILVMTPRGRALLARGFFRNRSAVAATRRPVRRGRRLTLPLLSIGWRSFFQIQDQRQNSAYQKHDRDQQHCRLPGSQLLNVSRRRLPHNLSAQVRLWVSREGFRRNKAWGWGCAEAFNGTTRGRPARRRCAARRELERRDPHWRTPLPLHEPQGRGDAFLALPLCRRCGS